MQSRGQGERSTHQARAGGDTTPCTGQSDNPARTRSVAHNHTTQRHTCVCKEGANILGEGRTLAPPPPSLPPSLHPSLLPSLPPLPVPLAWRGRPHPTPQHSCYTTPTHIGRHDTEARVRLERGRVGHGRGRAGGGHSAVLAAHRWATAGLRRHQRCPCRGCGVKSQHARRTEKRDCRSLRGERWLRGGGGGGRAWWWRRGPHGLLGHTFAGTPTARTRGHKTPSPPTHLRQPLPHNSTR
jgi:hypothetical protein